MHHIHPLACNHQSDQNKLKETILCGQCQDTGPVLVTGLTENIAILTRVAPATPPGSDASDLWKYQLLENNLDKNTLGVVNQFKKLNN